MPDTTAPRRPYVLLTGATGMVGSQVLAQLLARHEPVAVLVRDRAGAGGEPDIDAATRVDRLLHRFERCRGRLFKRPVVIGGDINADGLGLSQPARRWIAAHCGSVIHSAASLSFRPASESADNEPYRSNLEGTKRLFEFCRSLGIDDFHYISTAYVCGLLEGKVAEGDLERERRFANDYEQSKYEAERFLVRRAAPGKLTVFRPSIVIDSSGTSPVSEDRTVYGAYSMFRMLAGKFGLPAEGEWFRNLGLVGSERKNLVEADWLAQIIAGIYLSRKFHGRVYHLTAREGTPVSELERSFHTLTSEELRPAAADSKSSTASGERTSAALDMLAAPFVATFAPYFRNDPAFDRTHLDEAIRDLGLPDAPTVDCRVLTRMIRLRRRNESKPVDTAGEEAAERFPFARMLRGAAESCGFAEPAGCRDAVGILLSGLGGGDYSVAADGSRRIGFGGESCSCRMYLSTQAWEDLGRGTADIASLVESGQASVECEESEAGTAEAAADRIAAVAAALFNRLQSSASRTSRVIASGRDQ